MTDPVPLPSRPPRRAIRFTPSQALAASFLLAIAAGTFLFLLPGIARAGRLSFIDALFTATSGVCVTGLAVRDTATTFSPFGHVVLLGLIQLGGLGIMTFMAFIHLAAGRTFSIRERIQLQEHAPSTAPIDLRTLAWRIVKYTAAIELAGAVILFFGFQDGSPGLRAVFPAAFHAVSAFCNAGFSVFRGGLEPYRADAVVNLSVIGLVLLGGIGFFVLQEGRAMVAAWTRRSRFRTSLHTRIVLVTNALLLPLSGILLLVLEGGRAFAGLPPGEKALAALFHAVTPRTAGFNTVPMAEMGAATLLLIMALMFVGASPASTGGGVKTTTLAVALAFVRSRVRAAKTVNVSGRTLPAGAVITALGLLAAAAALVLVAAFALLLSQPGLGLTAALFEAVSAFGTVGLSLGVTAELTSFNKAVLIVTMYAGRVGPLTLLHALSRLRPRGEISYPEENVLIG